jgi:quercetin dioxygenase-like cupin family protein
MKVIPPREGEVIGDAPDRRVEMLSDVDPLHATWSRFGPGRDGASLHVHHHHTDLFYVLQGELTVKLGPDGAQTGAPAGTLVRVPPLVAHGFRNGSDAELRYLNLHAPGLGFADYMRGLADFDQADPPADGGRPASEASMTSGDGVLCEVDDIRVSVLTGEVDSHGHPEHVESLYVLEGELEVEGTRAAPGTWLQIPPGLPHAIAGSAR